VQCGQNLLYKIEIEATGQPTHVAANVPTRGQHAFQTDILIRKGPTPLVAIELKSRTFLSHDVITYSAKAGNHKRIYPYLRYGFIVSRSQRLGRRFVTHNEGFDFAMALPVGSIDEAALLAVVRRQIASAEQLIELTRLQRLNLRSYEEVVAVNLQDRTSQAITAGEPMHNETCKTRRSSKDLRRWRQHTKSRDGSLQCEQLAGREDRMLFRTPTLVRRP
jgi:hypothetical protein